MLTSSTALLSMTDMNSGVFRAGSALVLFTLVLLDLSDTLLAEYLYLQDDPRSVHASFINDLQDGHVDMKALSPTAQNTLRNLSNGTMIFPDLASLGKAQAICPVNIIDYPNGQQLSFRAIHEKGSMDWVVTVSRTPEKIQNLVFLPYRKGPPTVTGGGPPAVLPPFFPGGDSTLQPSIEIDCLSPAAKRSASDEEVRKACQEHPEMCGG